MDTNETKMCATCNVAMVDGTCPQCGAKAEMPATEAPAVETPATETPATDTPAV